jgi:hypothetical protein
MPRRFIIVTVAGHQGNRGLQRAVLAGLISACVQQLLADALERSVSPQERL